MKAHGEGCIQQTKVDQRGRQSDPERESLRKEIVMRIEGIDENGSYDSEN